ncbi:ABC transporter substrate-binding protein [Paenibacillus hodogayensis]|uniref:ABC transporter substrate-binding protein n=1 Tax=Paenibacillus hodogayensis TaxID=279208 RepID=A0ABV5VQT7_9BACL
MRMKSFICLIIMVAAAAGLSACGKGSDVEGTGAAGNTAGDRRNKSSGGNADKPDTEPAELIFFSENGMSANIFDQNYGDAIRKAFPAYTIKYIQKGNGTSMDDLIAAGTRIDIYLDSIGNYESRLIGHKLEFDMTDSIKQYGIDLSLLEPTVVEAVKQASGGKMYGLPVVSSNLALFYNQDIFDAFSVPYPKADMTWDEVLELAKKMTRMDGGKQYYGFAANNAMVNLSSLSIQHADLNTSLPTIQTDERWRRLFDTVFVRPAQMAGYREGMRALKDLPGLNQFAKEQNLAMLVYLNTLPTSVPTELKTMKWDILPLPVFPDMPGVGSQLASTYFGLTSQTKNKDAAMKVLKYMVSETYQNHIAGKGLIPVLNTDAVRQRLGRDTGFGDKNYAAFLQNKPAPIAPKTEYDAKLVSVYRKQIFPLAVGDIDMNTAFRAAEEEAVKVIAESRQ